MGNFFLLIFRSSLLLGLCTLLLPQDPQSSSLRPSQDSRCGRASTFGFAVNLEQGLVVGRSWGSRYALRSSTFCRQRAWGPLSLLPLQVASPAALTIMSISLN